MNNEILKLNIIVGLQIIGAALFVFEAKTLVEYLLLGVAIILPIGLIFRIEVVRKIQVACFMINAVLCGITAIVIPIAIGYTFFSDSTIGEEEGSNILLLSFVVVAQIVGAGFSWWAAKHLSSNYIKRLFTTNKAKLAGTS